MIRKFYPKDNPPKLLDEVRELLESGGILIYPTDTLYAVGCHALKERAVERICHLKGIDPRRHHLSIICPDLSGISQYAKIDNATFKLMKRNLPGPFTFIVPSGSRLPKIFRNRREVGIRIPDHPTPCELCRLIDAPLLTTTVPHDDGEDMGYLTDPELMEEKFGDRVDLILDGGPGGMEPGTVVRCADSEWEVIRQGKGMLDD